MDLISKSALWNKISHECHYDTEHPAESYGKLLSVIQEAPLVDAIIVNAPILTKRDVLNQYGITYISNTDLDQAADIGFMELVQNLLNTDEMYID